MERDVQVKSGRDSNERRESNSRRREDGSRQHDGGLRREEFHRRRAMRRKQRRRQRFLILLGASVCLAFAVICPSIMFYLNQKEKNTEYCTRYESDLFTQSLYEDTLYASSLCVGTDVKNQNYGMNSGSFHEAALFDVENRRTLYAERMFEQLYPASTTKLMTAYIVLKYANLDDIVVVGRNATIFEPEASLCGLQEGDRISLKDLLYGLILYSGNDNAVAIAEHVSGSVESFAELMNQEAWQLGATHSHFLNPHGLHEEGHYTTAYDLYLIFNACLQDSRFVEIISAPSYTGTMTAADGSVRYRTWRPTNYYTSGITPSPDGIRVIGGKTGTTNEAGSCLILYNLTSNSSDGREHPFISIVMGAVSKPDLYDNMSLFLSIAVEAAENNITDADSSSENNITDADSSSGNNITDADSSSGNDIMDADAE